MPNLLAVGRGRRPAQGEPVIDRALGLLGAFDGAHRRLTLADLARRSGMPLSTTRRLALRLVDWGALERDDSGAYRIGLRLWEVASLADRGPRLRDAAGPCLDDLSVATRHHLQLAVLDGRDAVVVDRRDGAAPVRVNYRIGGRLPLVATGSGRVLLAYATSALQDEILASAYPWPLCECPRPSENEVRAELAATRRSGVAVLRRPTSPVVSVATAVRDPDGRVVAALSALLPARHGDHLRIEPALRTAANEISQRLAAPQPVERVWPR